MGEKAAVAKPEYDGFDLTGYLVALHRYAEANGYAAVYVDTDVLSEIIEGVRR